MVYDERCGIRDVLYEKPNSEPRRKCAKKTNQSEDWSNFEVLRFEGRKARLLALKEPEIGSLKTKPSLSKSEDLSKPLILWPVCVAHFRIGSLEGLRSKV